MRRLYRILFSGILVGFFIFALFSFQVLNETAPPGEIHNDLYRDFEMDEEDSKAEENKGEESEEGFPEEYKIEEPHQDHAAPQKEHPDEQQNVEQQEEYQDQQENVEQHEEHPNQQGHLELHEDQNQQEYVEQPKKEHEQIDPEIPIILWWTPFTHQKWVLKTCGNEGQQCYVTEERRHINNTNTKVIIFYGTDFPVGDMPLPRQPHQQWALLHEESPKNVYMFSHSIIMELFNHTSTFKRESDYPVPMQFLKSQQQLEKTDYMVSIEEKNRRLSDLALVNYVHSDCNTPSDRDHLVKMLQRYIKVDSYGQCVHNKDLPEDLKEPLMNMLKPKFLHLLGNYKFTLATENAICDDYMTEKLWRPFMVGSVPIIWGSPKTRDFLPAKHSAIFVDDYKNIKDLVKHLEFLNQNDEEYEKYLEFKKTGIQNEYLKKLLKARDWNAENTHVPGKYYHFVEGFECYICRRLHESMQREKQNKPPLKFQADVSHYGCPKPKKFSDYPEGNLERVDDPFIAEEYVHSIYEAKIMRKMIDQGKQISFDQLYKVAEQLRRTENRSGL